MGRLAVAVVVAAGCGRIGFDTQSGGLDAAGDFFVVIDCPTTTPLGEPYACTPIGPPPRPELTWSLGAATTCAWMSVNADTGVIAGTPQALETCDADLVVSHTDGRSSHGAWSVTVVAAVVAQIDIGAYHACALSTAGTVRCWGHNGFGQLGYNDTMPVGNGAAGRSIVDMGDVPVGGRVTQISLAYDQTCALLDTGGVRCWGAGSFSRLGYDHTMNVGDGGAGGTIIENGDVPLGGPAVEVAAIGGAGGCARMMTGAVRCWGLWHGHDHAMPVRGAQIAIEGDTPIGPGRAVALAGGYGHVCALTDLGTVRCWGFNGYGELGYNSGENVGDGSGPSIAAAGDVPVGGSVAQISAGDFTTCAVLAGSGALRCWGYNQYGQLGYNDTVSVGDGTAGRSIIQMGDVPVGGAVATAWAGEEHTCALLTDGVVRCWGLNLEGQLGYDDTLPVGDGTRSIIAAGNVAVGGAVTDVVTTDWDSGFTCALLESRAVRCWGANGSGQLGQDHAMNVGDGGPGGTIIDNGDVLPFAQ